ncbi:Flp pilus assembly protein CpaB [Reyranella sp. CPCC 100927]|uniref:Flp pilus assembly protein CpaB n=1 Tax=Reyranella sp. CPCC 100927 TaxID=2599616 RepID=UPI0011B617A8|nr:Flp pilus assembly protein CpaB [Reyranella sp. CPCC 100927]TWT10213.1 Flp pilus assembly protein CpaB [Reyranella sp. CPCC 100927]
MNPQRIIMLIVALMIAGGTVLFLRSYLDAERRAAKQVTQPAREPIRPALQVLVARSEVRTGQIVKPDDLRWQAWPEGSLSPAYAVEGLRPLTDFVGAVARSPISPGEPITEGKLVLPGSRGFMAAVLQPGMRAVSVPVTVTSGISGFVFAGDKVDLILTHSLQPAAQGEKEPHASETILRDIRVIAMDQRSDAKPGEQAQIAKTATFEVTPKQSEIITLALEMGKLSLTLRSLQETTDTPLPEGPSYTRDTDVSVLLSSRPSSRPVEPSPSVPTAAPPPSASVTIIRGSVVAESGPAADGRNGSGGGTKP